MSDNPEISIRPATNADCENVQTLVFSVLCEYDLQPDLNGTDSDIADIEAAYINRGGVFELLEDEHGKLLGTVGLYPITDEKLNSAKCISPKTCAEKATAKRLCSE